MPHRAYDSSEVLNGVIAPDAYTERASISYTPIKRIILDVMNQAIYWQLQSAPGVWEDVEHLMTPGSRAIVRGNVTGIRFRAFTPAASLPTGATQAVVTVEAVK